MAKKWQIFSSKVEWYDIKTKFKKILRSVTYSQFIQSLICEILIAYMRFVIFSSKVTFVGDEKMSEAIKNNQPIILTFWHNRLIMAPFLANKVLRAVKKTRPEFRFMTLASKHGDGKFVGLMMEKFHFISILGSTNNGRKKSRGIDIGSFRQIINGLKSGNAFGITPDGPRGPNQQINGEIVNIARISGAAIVAASYSSSRFKELKTWDKFRIPLPFSNSCFYCCDPIFIDKKTDKAEVVKLNKLLKEQMDFAQKKSLEAANS